MIDITKKWMTREGKIVVNLNYTPLNSCGNKVTYPIKGTIILRDKPLKTTYAIWSEDGISDVVWRNNSEQDLVAYK